MRKRYATSRSVQLVVGMLAGFVLVGGASGQISPDPDDRDFDPELTCRMLPDGVPCPDRIDQPGDCTEPVCDQGRCVERPLSGRTACRDTDGDPFTLARCEPDTGRCDQRAATRPRFTSDAPQDVEVVALTFDVLPQPTAFVDCCWFCQHQNLEALRAPTPTDPQFRPLDPGEDARRAKYCGTVVDYGVNDELDDPRDILINIVPASGFEGFVTGFPRTACSPAAPCIHAEVTPANQFYEEDDVFLPISNDEHCDDGGIGRSSCSSLLEEERRSVCVYGPYAFDHGGHDTSSHRDFGVIEDDRHDHPEIHPFDAIWWSRPAGNGYVFGVFQDDSNRYSEPYCGSQHNSSGWSQAPRDMRFRFPFSFPLSEAPVRADLRRVRTRDFDGRFNEVLPLNATTGMFTRSTGEGDRRRFVSDGELILEVVEQEELDPEVEVGLEATVDGRVARGFVTLRVAVGCDPRSPSGSCSDARLRAASPNGRHDADDQGSGYFYGELSFGPAPPPGSLEVRIRLEPANDPGRFDLLVDDGVVASRVGNGATTGRRSLTAGNHRVTQRAALGTRLGDYRTTITGACSSTGTVELSRGENAVCTITNTNVVGSSDDCEVQCERERDACMSDREARPGICIALLRQCKAGCA